MAKKQISRKGQVNDVSILAGLVFVFFLLGGLLPFILTGFSSQTNVYGLEGLAAGTGQSLDSQVSQVSASNVIISIATMFFWTFGLLPFWLDIIFEVFRIMFYVLLYRQIRSGGG